MPWELMSPHSMYLVQIIQFPQQFLETYLQQSSRWSDFTFLQAVPNHNRHFPFWNVIEIIDVSC